MSRVTVGTSQPVLLVLHQEPVLRTTGILTRGESWMTVDSETVPMHYLMSRKVGMPRNETQWMGSAVRDIGNRHIKVNVQLHT